MAPGASFLGSLGNAMITKAVPGSSCCKKKVKDVSVTALKPPEGSGGTVSGGVVTSTMYTSSDTAAPKVNLSLELHIKVLGRIQVKGVFQAR